MKTKIAAFIDGPSLLHSTRGLGFDVDFKRLLAYLDAGGDLLRAMYYTGAPASANSKNAQQFVDWLDYNSFTVRVKPLKLHEDAGTQRKPKTGMSVDLAVDALELVHRVDRILLFSGDGDYRRLIEALQRRAARVVVISTVRTTPPILADELRRQADEFVELDDLRTIIGRSSEKAPARKAG